MHNVVLFEYENMAMKDNQNEVARDMWVEALSSLFKGDSKEELYRKRLATAACESGYGIVSLELHLI
ncbi:hypothetical protein KLMIMM047B_29815 [Klebsiella michiganensis]